MVTLHEVITFLVSMQISISSLQTHNVNRCGRSRHLARKLSLRRKRSSPNVFEMAATETITSIILIKLRSEERFSRNAETDLVCRLLLEKKKNQKRPSTVQFEGLVQVRGQSRTRNRRQPHDVPCRRVQSRGWHDCGVLCKRRRVPLTSDR